MSDSCPNRRASARLTLLRKAHDRTKMTGNDQLQQTRARSQDATVKSIHLSHATIRERKNDSQRQKQKRQNFAIDFRTNLNRPRCDAFCIVCFLLRSSMHTAKMKCAEAWKPRILSAKVVIFGKLLAHFRSVQLAVKLLRTLTKQMAKTSNQKFSRI